MRKNFDQFWKFEVIREGQGMSYIKHILFKYGKNIG